MYINNGFMLTSGALASPHLLLERESEKLC
jgi:hypothetical protein